MNDLSQLLTAHAFPAGLDRIRRSFARQADDQTCGAAAIRHGLLLGGLTVPAAALEAMLAIRANQGTDPAALSACLRGLGLQPSFVRKPVRQATADFLDGLRPAFDDGAFLVPCIYGAAHWVCVGAWLDGRVGMVDSFYDRDEPAPLPQVVPGLGFFWLSPEQLDGLDWPHFVTLVEPGRWRRQYRTWLPARATLLRHNARPPAGGGSPTTVQAIRQGVHQYLDDAEYTYRRLHLHLGGAPAASLAIDADDPGVAAVGVEALGEGDGEVVVVRRLGGMLCGRPAAPELVVRLRALRAGHLA